MKQSLEKRTKDNCPFVSHVVVLGGMSGVGVHAAVSLHKRRLLMQLAWAIHVCGYAVTYSRRERGQTPHANQQVVCMMHAACIKVLA